MNGVHVLPTNAAISSTLRAIPANALFLRIATVWFWLGPVQHNEVVAKVHFIFTAARPFSFVENMSFQSYHVIEIHAPFALVMMGSVSLQWRGACSTFSERRGLHRRQKKTPL